MFFQGTADIKFDEIREYIGGLESYNKEAIDLIYNDYSMPADEQKLARYRHRVGAKLLEVQLVNEDDEAESIINEFFDTLSDDKYTDTKIIESWYVPLNLLPNFNFIYLLANNHRRCPGSLENFILNLLSFFIHKIHRNELDNFDMFSSISFYLFNIVRIADQKFFTDCL